MAKPALATPNTPPELVDESPFATTEEVAEETTPEPEDAEALLDAMVADLDKTGVTPPAGKKSSRSKEALGAAEDDVVMTVPFPVKKEIRERITGAAKSIEKTLTVFLREKLQPYFDEMLPEWLIAGDAYLAAHKTTPSQVSVLKSDLAQKNIMAAKLLKQLLTMGINLDDMDVQLAEGMTEADYISGRYTGIETPEEVAKLRPA